MSFWFLAVVTLFLLWDNSGFGCYALSAVFLHESGHLLALFAMKTAPRALSFSAEGICLLESTKPLSTPKQALVLVSGSGVNFLCCLCFLLMKSDTALQIAALHGVLGIFNLLPMNSLDGGKLLALTLSRFCSPYLCQRILAVTSFVCAVTLLCFGGYLLFTTKNISLLFTGIALAVIKLTEKQNSSCNSMENRL